MRDFIQEGRTLYPRPTRRYSWRWKLAGVGLPLAALLLAAWRLMTKGAT